MGQSLGKHKNRKPQPVPICDKKGHVSANGETVKAMYDYVAMNDGDLSFKKGDKLIVVNKNDPDWWEAELVRNGSIGFIPCNYIVADNATIESQEWWFNVDRREAVTHLILAENKIGAFMVRKTEDDSSLALSVLSSRDAGEKQIKHFKIKQDDQGKVYLSSAVKFDSVENFVKHYQKNVFTRGLRLVHPSLREMKNVPFKELEVDRKKIKLGDKLGDGKFGVVHKATINKKQVVAVKMLKEHSLMNAVEFEKEARIMHKLRHPRLVQLMGVCMKEEPYYIITEFMGKGSLLGFLKSRDEAYDVTLLIDLAFQVADGMEYLESRDPPYIHRDLRAANCLVNESNVAKVADFGLAKMVDDGIYEGGEYCKFPIKWTAPEGLENKLFTVKSDVWSYGILLYEIFTVGKSPYPGWDNFRIKDEVLKGYKLTIPDDNKIICPRDVKEIMAECLTSKGEERPSFSKLQDFFSSLSSSTDSYQSFDENK